MRLRKPCEHDRYDEHWFRDDSAKTMTPCPGGEFLHEDALVIEKENGEWPQALKGWGGLLSVLLDLQNMDAALADQVGERG